MYSYRIDLKKQKMNWKSKRLIWRYSHRQLRNFKSISPIAKQIASVESQYNDL
jgi:hypothetical protein